MARRRTSPPDRRRASHEGKPTGLAFRMGTVIDRVLSVPFPNWAARRTAGRVRGAMLANYFDATDGGRLHGPRWLLRKLSPDSAHEAEGETLRERANKLYRTDGHFAGHVHRGAIHAVNTGIMPRPAIVPGEGIDEDRADSLNRQLKALRDKMIRGVDPDGRRHLGRVQRLISRCLDKDGEALVVFSDVPIEGKPLPLAVEVVNISRLETPPQEAGNNRIRLGIERGGGKRPGTVDPKRRDLITHYHIRTQHPYDTKLTEIKYDRVPVELVRHLYEDFDADQSRGWPAAGVTADHSRNRHDMGEATLIGQQVRACFAGFRYTEHPGGLKAAQENEDGLMELEPGRIERLPNGEKIAFPNLPGSNGGELDAYMMGLLAEEAAAVGVPTEMYAGRYGDMNLSVYKGHRQNARMGWRVRRQQIGMDFLLPWWERLVAEAVLAGLLDVSADEFLRDPDAFMAVTLVPPYEERLDEARESKAEIEQVRAGHAARGQVLNARGGDDEETQRLKLEEGKRDLDNEAELYRYRQTLIAAGKLPPDPPPPGPSPAQPGNPAANRAGLVPLTRNGNGRPVHA